MKKVFIFISHDLGGAEAIDLFIKKSNIEPNIIALGPAAKLLKKYNNVKDNNKIEKLLYESKSNANIEIIVSTGWTDFEIKWMEK